ncbi:MAG TPA: helix-turn-helix domain-containing protein [Nitrospira sp.]|nr:helix-turn-helix domain-containing protein [Nitrospira sp.]
MKKQVTKRYSEAFKRQVVSEYEEGHNVVSLQARYGITGNGTIERWVKKYAHAGLRHELVIIQRGDERDRQKAVEARVRELETAVAQLTLEKIVLESSLAEAEKLLGMEVKKNGAPPSSKPALNTR